MNTKIKTLILVLLVSSTLCQYVPKTKMPKGTVTSKDLLEFDLGEIFGISGADIMATNFSASQSTGKADIGQVYNYLQPYAMGPVTDAQQINFAKSIDDTSFVVIHDSNKLKYYETDTDRSMAKNTWEVSLGKFGSKVVCQDVSMSPNHVDMYVGCSARTVGPIKVKDNMFLVLIDRKQQKVLNTIAVNMTESFDITNELRIQYLDIHQSQSEHVIVYNQGRTNSLTTRLNMDFMIFKRIGSDLEPAETNITTYHLKGASNNTDFLAVYDIFSFASDHIIVSGRRQGSENEITLSTCAINLNEEDVLCSDPMSTGIKKGKVDFTTGTGLVSVYDYLASQVHIYTTNGYEVTDPNWMSLVNSINITTPIDTTNQWIRSSNGDQNAMVFKWSSTQHLTTEISVINWDKSIYNNFHKVSATVLGNVLVAIDQSHFTMSRFGNPFFKVGGAELSTDVANILQISGMRKGAKTLIAHSSLYQVSGTTVDVKFKYPNPYTDAFPDSTFFVPFFNENVVQGNNIKWRIEYDSNTTFSHSTIVDEFYPEITLKPHEPRSGWAKVAMTSGFFVAQDRGTVVHIYSCIYPNMHSKGCQRLLTQKLIEGEVLQTTIYGKGDMVMFWTQNGNASPPRSNVYVCDINASCQKNKLNVEVNDVTFFEDSIFEHFVVAAAQYTPADKSQGLLHIYSIDNDDHTDFTLLSKFNAEWFSLNEFCPTEVHPDPNGSRVHVLSTCQAFTGKGGNKIVSFDVIIPFDRSSGPSHTPVTVVPISGAIGKPSFCPMADHHIIVDFVKEGADVLWAIDDFPSHSHYHKYLNDYDLKNLIKFQCLPLHQHYVIVGTVGGKPGQSNYIYGLFSGESKLNNHKFIRRLDANLDYQKWNNMDTYALDHVFLHVGYPSHEGLSPVNYAANVRKAPMIFTRVEHVQGDFEPKKVNFKVIATSNSKDFSAQGTVVLKHANTSILYETLSYWNGAHGVYNLEKMTRIWGPIEEGSMIGYEAGFRFTGRKSNHGGLYAPDNELVFDQFRGTYKHGMALTIDENLCVFSQVSDSTITAARGKKGIYTFDFQPVLNFGKPRSLNLYAGRSSRGNYIGAMSFGPAKNTTLYSKFELPLNADKIRLCNSQNQNTGEFIGFALNRKTHEAYVLQLVSTMKDIQIKHISTVTNIWDMDCTTTTEDNVELYWIPVEGTQILMTNWAFDGQTWTASAQEQYTPNSDQQYWLADIAASTSENVTHIAASTLGTVVYIVDRDAASKNYTLVNTVQKYKDYIQDSTFITKDYLVQRSMSNGRSSSAILVWKTRSPDNTIHTAITTNRFIPPGENTKKGENLQMPQKASLPNGVPFSFFMGTDGKSEFPVIAVGSTVASSPLIYYSIGDFTLSIPENYDENSLNNLKFSFSGSTESSVDVTDFLRGEIPGPFPKPEKSTVNFWPFVAIIAILIIAAIGWFIYSRSKQVEEEEAEYFSMQPESKVTDAEAVEEGLEDGIDDGLEEEGLN